MTYSTGIWFIIPEYRQTERPYQESIIQFKFCRLLVHLRPIHYLVLHVKQRLSETGLHAYFYKKQISNHLTRNLHGEC